MRARRGQNHSLPANSPHLQAQPAEISFAQSSSTEGASGLSPAQIAYARSQELNPKSLCRVSKVRVICYTAKTNPQVPTVLLPYCAHLTQCL